MATETTVSLERVWGLRVRDRRKLLGLTQRQLAEMVKPATTQATIWKIENGRIAPRDSLKARLAAALATTPEALFPWAHQLEGAA